MNKLTIITFFMSFFIKIFLFHSEYPSLICFFALLFASFARLFVNDDILIILHRLVLIILMKIVSAFNHLHGLAFNWLRHLIANYVEYLAFESFV